MAVEQGGAVDARRGPRAGRRAAALGALALLALHFASFAPADQPIVSDVRLTLYDAWRVTEGATPHRDLYAVKPPLAVLLGAGLHVAGEGIGSDPLFAVRAGYLALSALGGWLAFFAFRALAGGSAVAGLLAVLAVAGFGLQGALPAIGPVAKHAGAVLAWGVGLCAYRRRWALGGALAVGAFLDWQVWGLAGVGLVAASRWDAGAPRAALGRVLLGAGLGFAPLGLWLARHGALGDFASQVTFGAFARGAASLGVADAAPAWLRIARSAPDVCPEQSALVWLALAGIGVAWWEFARERRGAERVRAAALRLRVALLVPMTGVALFSALDFQAYGDWLALLHALAFFLASVYVVIHRVLGARWSAGSAAKWSAALALLAAFAAARPGPLRPALWIRAAGSEPGLTLSEQRALASRAAELIGPRELAALDNAEILYLLRRVNPLPLAYWDSAALAALGRANETRPRAASRVLDQTGAGALIFPHDLAPEPELAARLHAVDLASAAGRYRLRLYLR
jgi:hypothetical protein